MIGTRDISSEVWRLKYRWQAIDGAIRDESVQDTWRRVARALAAAEKDPELWAPRFYAAMDGFRFLPAGRILAGAGTARVVTLFNCFVMGTIPDRMDGIFEHLKQAAVTLQHGGGIGYDFSSLRPRGAPVRGVEADASGPVSFMEVWNAMCRTVMSAGYRRGAMMATLRCDHPDIEVFVDAKRDRHQLRMFNMSVLVTDAFMAAVDRDEAWPLRFGGHVYRTVAARGLWDRIMRSTYEYAEPGIVFIDRINRLNNLAYCEDIISTNPCAEQPLPEYGACLLGSINLASLVREPFSEEARLDEDELARITETAVRMLDDAIEVSEFPLPQHEREAKAKRRIGLGITGLADALIMCRQRYGSGPAIELMSRWMRRLRDAAYRTSVAIARERGSFPLFDVDRYLAGPTVAGLPETLRADIARYGIRNALLTSIAPAGTISLLAGNVSSGIEPVFSFVQRRVVRQTDGVSQEWELVNHSYQRFRDMFGAGPLPEYFVDSGTLKPVDHLAVQAEAQKFIDSSISKTINCPAELSFEEFEGIYRDAYRRGCKGCATFRPNPVTGSVLTPMAEPDEELLVAGVSVDGAELRCRTC